MPSSFNLRVIARSWWEAREAARLDRPPTQIKRVKFTQQVVGEPESVAQRMLLVLKAHRELDWRVVLRQKQLAWKWTTLQLLMLHIHWSQRDWWVCFSSSSSTSAMDEFMTQNAYHMWVGTVNYHTMGNHLKHYKSLHSTSKVEAVHSVLDRIFYSQWGIGTEVFDACLGWWVLPYNRWRLCALGKRFHPIVCHQRYN